MDKVFHDVGNVWRIKKWGGSEVFIRGACAFVERAAFLVREMLLLEENQGFTRDRGKAARLGRKRLRQCPRQEPVLNRRWGEKLCCRFFYTKAEKHHPIGRQRTAGRRNQQGEKGKKRKRKPKRLVFIEVDQIHPGKMCSSTV